MTAYAIIQHPHFEDDVLPGGHNVIFRHTFWRTSQFVKGLREAITALHQLDDAIPKALIISTHGKALTGTRLDTVTGSVDLWEYKDYFGVLPNNLVVYVNACWGGYPSPAAAIQSGTRVPPVVGPMVNIYPQLADAFQSALLDLLDAGMPSDRALYRLVRHYNSDAMLRDEHYGGMDWLFGLWSRSRVFHPAEAAGNQLAAPVADNGRFEVIEPVLHAESGAVIAWVVADSRGQRFQADVAQLPELLDVDPDCFIGATLDASFQLGADPDDYSDAVRIIGLPIIHIMP
jgi:hypothetical protein